MVKNYIITALRNLSRNKGYTAINIVGLAFGLACCILITLYIGHQWSFDKFHVNAERIYRLNLREFEDGNEHNSPITSPAMGTDIKKNFPEVEYITRIGQFGGDFSYNNKITTDYNLIIADSSFLDIFSFKLIKGNKKTALLEPFSIVLTESLSKKIFGNEDPIGKTLIRNNSKEVYRVTGIVENAPNNSTIQFSGLISFQTLYNLKTGTLTEWDGNFSYETFLLIKAGVDIDDLSRKIIELADRIINPKLKQFNYRLEPTLQPIQEIHLFSDFDGESGMASTLYIFTAIALFILFIAGFNFVNLSTAQSSKRAKEVGVRMISGSTKNQIRFQYLGETIILCLIAGLLSLLLVELLMPIYNNILGVELSLYQSRFWWLQIGIPFFIIIYGILAGLYPAFYVTSLKPIHIIKSDIGSKSGKSFLRNILVSIQFMVSTILIICTIILFLQLQYLQNKNIGIDTNNLLVIGFNGSNPWKRVERLSNELNDIPEIESVSYATEPTGEGFTMNGYMVEGIKNPVMIKALGVSKGYINNLGIKITQGRNFSDNLSTDSTSVLINETLVKQVGWTDPIGKKIIREKEFHVIGVIKDFHYTSMHSAIKPLIMFLPFKQIRDYWHPYIHIRVKPKITQEIIGKIETAWNKTQPGYSMNYHLISDTYKNHYQVEKKFSKIFIYFTLLAIVISCLGLLGLASFNMKTKTREVSIRKVMGASTLIIIRKLSLDFTRWTLIGNLCAWPIAWFIMDKALSIYPYRILMPWWVFVFTAILLFSISILTILYQTIRTAKINPAQTLKYE